MRSNATLQAPKEGSDASFLVNSKFSKEVGLKPKAVYRNLAPAALYEMVGKCEAFRDVSCVQPSSWRCVLAFGFCCYRTSEPQMDSEHPDRPW